MSEAWVALEWTQRFSVGHDDLDAQHRELFRRADEVIEGAARGDEVELGGLIEFLHEYAVAHFALEEDHMRATEFPGYLRHRAEHQRFLEDLLELADEHERGGRDAGLAAKLSAWLAEWMQRHVEGVDTELGRHLARPGHGSGTPAGAGGP